MEYAIKTHNLTKEFGKFTAVSNIDLSITKGAIHGFVGPNGAGKTTTIKMLIGAMHPTRGSGMISGHEIGTKESRQKIGYVPEKATFYKNLNAIEYLIYMGQLSGLSYEEAIKRAFDMLELFELIPYMYNKPVNYSSGMKRKLTFAQSLMHRPELLILDEPTANLDPETRMFIIDILKQLVKEQRLTIFISSHILTELELLVDEVTLIDQGAVILTGKIEEIRNRFNQGVFIVNTSNNEKLLTHLNTFDYISSITLSDQDEIKIITKETERLKREIGKIIYDLGINLHSFFEEKITLDNIYKSVFSRNEQYKEKNDEQLESGVGE